MREFQLILIIAGCLMLQPLSTDLYLPSLPSLAEYFDIPVLMVQQTLVFFSVGFGIAQLISGPISDRYGRRPVLLSGLLLYMGASLACAIASNIYVLIAARFAQACGCCTIVVTARAMIRDSYSPTAGAQKLAQASSYMGFAVVSGPIIGAHLQNTFHWNATFIFLTVISIPLLLAVWYWSKNYPPPPPHGRALDKLMADYPVILRSKSFWAYTLAGALSYASIFVFISGSAFVLIQVLGVSILNFGYCFAIGCTGYLNGSFLCRRLLATISVERTLLYGTFLSTASSAIFLALCIFNHMTWWLLIGFQFVAMFAHAINFPCAQVGSLAKFERNAGTAAGVFGALSMCGALIVSNLMGVMFDSTYFPMAYLAAGIAITQLVTVVISYNKNALTIH